VRQHLRGLLALVGVLAFGLMTGCAERPPPPPAEAPSPAAPSSTATGPMPRYQSVPELNQALTDQLRTDRTIRFTNESSMPLQPSLALSGDGEIGYDYDGFRMRSHQQIRTADSAPTDLWVLMVPGTNYLRAPPGMLKLPPSTPWVAVVPGADNDATRAFGPLLDLIRQSVDPTLVFSPYGSALTLVSADPEQLGPTPTMHYSVRLDVPRGAAEAPLERVRQLLARVQQSGTTSIDTQVWLDADNHLVQLESASPVASTQVTTLVSRVRYHDWGRLVVIDAPPAAQVVGH
jgi:hypothetical protein